MIISADNLLIYSPGSGFGSSFYAQSWRRKGSLNFESDNCKTMTSMLSKHPVPFHRVLLFFVLGTSFICNCCIFTTAHLLVTRVSLLLKSLFSLRFPVLPPPLCNLSQNYLGVVHQNNVFPWSTAPKSCELNYYGLTCQGKKRVTKWTFKILLLDNFFLLVFFFKHIVSVLHIL